MTLLQTKASLLNPNGKHNEKRMNVCDAVCVCASHSENAAKTGGSNFNFSVKIKEPR